MLGVRCTACREVYDFFCAGCFSHCQQFLSDFNLLGPFNFICLNPLFTFFYALGVADEGSCVDPQE